MMASGSNIAEPLNLGVIGNYRSYWATHFLSVLECLRHHNTLQWPGRKLENIGKLNWSMEDLKAVAPSNFFMLIDQQMHNWGMQYFLATFLNRMEAAPIVQALIDKLSELWGETFDSSEYWFWISGHDSNLGNNVFLQFDDIFPRKVLLDLPDKQSIINNSDLCLILHSNVSTDDLGMPKKVGIFGEVEGLHGEFLTRTGYWKGKSDYCVFAFGVTPEKGTGAYIDTKVIGSVNRVIVTLQTEHPVVKDFRTALWWIAHLFDNGRFTKLPPNMDEDMGLFLDIIKNNFHVDILEVISMLSAFVSSDDMMISDPGPSTIITTINA